MKQRDGLTVLQKGSAGSDDLLTCDQPADDHCPSFSDRTQRDRADGDCSSRLVDEDFGNVAAGPHP